MMNKLVIAALLLISVDALAQTSWGIGLGGGCRDVQRQMVRDWMDIKHILTDERALERPRAKDFTCISPQSMYQWNAMERRAGTSNLRCYQVDSRGVCCDAEMQACAML